MTRVYYYNYCVSRHPSPCFYVKRCVLNKNRPMDNVQKHNNCMNIQVPLHEENNDRTTTTNAHSDVFHITHS